MWSMVGDLLMWNLLPKLDTLNYRFGMFEAVVDAEEAVRAIRKLASRARDVARESRADATRVGRSIIDAAIGA